MKVYNSQGASNTPTIPDRADIGKDGFMKILAAQLQNQDPMNAQDNSQYVAQLAQFSALEQMQTLNKSMNNLILSQKFQEGNMLIGKVVKIDKGEDGFITGKVSSIKSGDNTVNVVIDGTEYNIEDVLEVKENEEEKKKFDDTMQAIKDSLDGILDGVTNVVDQNNQIIEGSGQDVVPNN